MEMSIETALKNLDKPIQSVEEDLLQRSGFVENLCRIFETASPDESSVFALHGEWGSGKTSVKNLLVKKLAKRGDNSPIAIDFNPWAFSGQDQVLEAFFSEIGKSIGRQNNGKEAAEGFKKLGAYLSFGAKTVKALHLGMDLFGIPGSKLVGLAGEQLEGGSATAKAYGEDLDAVSSTSLEDVQKDLLDALAKLNRPVLIILDDLDRLTPDQLLTIFQIVKQNANLPGVNYLLLMDIETIAERLKQKGLGAEFVEKIVQFDLALPHVSSEELKTILKEGFQVVMGKYAGQINWERWDEAWINGTQNLFTTLRRIKRFLHTLKFHVHFFANDDVLEVDPVDLFLIETIRKSAPETYLAIPREFRETVIFEDMILRAIRLRHDEKKDEFGKKKLAELTALAPEDHRIAIERILTLIFPQVNDSVSDEDRNQALRDSRVCDQLSFDSYFRLAIPDQIMTQQEIVNLFTSIDDQTKFRSVLMSLYEKVGLNNLFHRIWCHREKLNAKYLSRLLAELWRLEAFDAKDDGVERDWHFLDASQQITKSLLSQYCEQSSRCEIAAEALTQSKEYYPLTMLWIREKHAIAQNPGFSGTAFNESDLEKLRPIILNEIHKASTDGRLLNRPDLGFFMLMWRDLENKEVVQNWLDEQTKDAKKLPKILTTFINKQTITGHREVKINYVLTRQHLEQFFSPVEKIAPVLASLNINSLPHWEKFAVEQALERISEKKQGIEEAKYE